MDITSDNILDRGGDEYFSTLRIKVARMDEMLDEVRAIAGEIEHNAIELYPEDLPPNWNTETHVKGLLAGMFMGVDAYIRLWRDIARLDEDIASEDIDPSIP